MVPQDDRRIKKKPVPELEADREGYIHLLEDMRQNAGPLIADPNWLMADDVSRPANTYDKGEALKIALPAQAEGLASELVAAVEGQAGAGEASRLRKTLDAYEEGQPWRATSPDEILMILAGSSSIAG